MFDVAIIGGGLAACSAALHLRLKGASVILLERGRCGAQASGVNYGGVRQQGRHEAELPLARRSREIWSRLETLIGSNCEFESTGHLKLARHDDDMVELQAYRDMAEGYGLHLDILGRDQLHKDYPFIAQSYAGASLCRQDGQANPRLVAPAFAYRARQLGAVIHEGCEVVGASRNSQGFELSVAGHDQPYRARRLINTAGAWGAKVAGWFGDRVDEQVMAPNMCVTEPIPPLIGPNLGVCGGSIYLRQSRNGSVIFGAGLGWADTDRLRARPCAQTTRQAAKAAIAMVPSLSSVLVIRTWTGIEGRMADGLPVVGPSPSTNGLIHAFGFSGHGFQLGPGVGAVLAELSLDGETPTPIEGLSFSRCHQGPSSASQS